MSLWRQLTATVRAQLFPYQPAYREIASAEELLRKENWHRYSHESNDDIGDSHKKSRCLQIVQILTNIFASAALIYCIATVASESIFNRYHGVTEKRTYRNSDCFCGHNLEEAMALNCKFDELAAAWLPRYCIDEDLSAEFAMAGPHPDGKWGYYDSPWMNNTLTTHEMSQLAGTGVYIWVTKEWHIMHCIYYWLKIERANDNKNIMVESRYGSHGHAHHCMRTVKKHEIPWRAVETHFGIMLTSAKEPVVDLLPVPEWFHQHDHADHEAAMESWPIIDDAV